MATNPKLCQIVAVVSGMKTQAQKALTNAHQHRLKANLLSGLTRTYRPVSDEGETLPPEVNRVQATVPDVLKEVRAALVPVYDAVLTQDVGNTRARADVKVGDRVLLPGVPVTHLMYLEKQLEDLVTFLDGLPTLDLSEQWGEKPVDGVYQTPPYETLKQAKVYKTHIAHPPTEHHPAQVHTFTMDETIGRWTNIKYSGAIPASQKNAMAARARALKAAVKVAREEANAIEVEQKKEGDAIFQFLLEGS
jgi:hypothetical protein